MSGRRLAAIMLLVGVACTSEPSTSAAPASLTPASASPASPPSPRSSLEGARGVLAEQRVARASSSPYYVSLVAIEEGPTVAADPAREPGFELAVAGTERITIDGSATELAAGHALAIAEGGSRQREADRANSYFLSLRSADQRERSLPPGRSILYESSDLPRSAVPPGGYDDLLVLLVLAPGQVVPPHSHGGIEPTFVIEGTVELRVRGQPVRRLSAGDADTVLPDTPLLLTNVGATVARVLVMLATPDGKVVQSPAETP